MKRLLHMNWNENWKNYVLYGRENLSITYDRLKNIDVDNYAVYSVMEQLKDSGMSVYDAYLKGLEAKYASSSKNIKSIQKELIRLKRDEIKFIKNQVEIDADEIKVIHDISCVLYQRYAKLLKKK